MIYINPYVFATAVGGYTTADIVTFPFTLDVSGPINSAGIKWLKFTITSGVHQIELNSASAPANSALAVFDNAGNIIVSSAAPSPNSNLSYFFSVGTFYIAVIAYDTIIPTYNTGWTVIGADDTLPNPTVIASGIDLSTLLQHLQVALILDTAQGAVDHNNITLTLV